MLVLSDAYAKCRSAEVGRQLAEAARWAFKGFPVSGKDDAEFIRNAMRWYKANKDHLTVNYEYNTDVQQGLFNHPHRLFKFRR